MEKIKYINLQKMQDFLSFLVRVPALKISVILLPIILFLHALTSFVNAVRWW